LNFRRGYCGRAFHPSPLPRFLRDVSHLLLVPFVAYSIVISLPLCRSFILFLLHYSLPIVSYYCSFPFVLCTIVSLILCSFLIVLTPFYLVLFFLPCSSAIVSSPCSLVIVHHKDLVKLLFSVLKYISRVFLLLRQSVRDTIKPHKTQTHSSLAFPFTQHTRPTAEPQVSSARTRIYPCIGLF